MIRSVVVFVAIPLVIGCTAKPPDVLKETKAGEFEITRIKPPKHFSLELRNVSTGEVHRSVYQRVHYSNYSKLSVGMRMKLTEQIYEAEDGTRKSRFDNQEVGAALEKLISERTP